MRAARPRQVARDVRSRKSADVHFYVAPIGDQHGCQHAAKWKGRRITELCGREPTDPVHLEPKGAW